MGMFGRYHVVGGWVLRLEEQTTARAKCGGLSTAAAKAPPSVEMTIFFARSKEADNSKGNGNGNSNGKGNSKGNSKGNCKGG